MNKGECVGVNKVECVDECVTVSKGECVGSGSVKVISTLQFTM